MKPTLVHRRVAMQAARCPEAIALRCGRRYMTYRELDERANQLARRMLRRGVGVEEAVVICMPRDIELVVAMLAVLRAGAGFAVLGADSTRQRLAFASADLATPVAIADASTGERFYELAPHVMCVDDDAMAIGAECCDPLRVRVAANNLAYATYTSGPGGEPRALLVEHGGLAALVDDRVRRLALRPGKRVAFLAAAGSGAAVLELFTALAAGATVHVAAEPPRSMPAMIDWLVSERITHAAAPARLGAVMASSRLPAAALLEVLEVGARMVAPNGGGVDCRIFTRYGPAEVGSYATLAPVHRRGAVTRRAIVGAPIAGASVHILDRQLGVVRPGEVGELWIGGVGVARGYLHRPAATAASFLPDRFASAPGSRLFRTGDRARLRADGQLELCGQVAAPVKMGGDRVELADVESAFLDHPDVAECVASVESRRGSDRLVAHVRVESGSIDSADLRSFVAARLPRSHVPALVLVRQPAVDDFGETSPYRRPRRCSGSYRLGPTRRWRDLEYPGGRCCAQSRHSCS